MHPNDDLSDINSFINCDLVEDEYETKWHLILKYVGVTSYLFAQLIWTIIVLRLFLSRVLMLSMSYDKLKEEIERKKSQRKLQFPSKLNRMGSLSRVRSNTGSVTHTDNSQSPSAQNDGSGMKERRLDRQGSAYKQKIEAKNSEVFLNLAIKTTNLIIVSICTNYIILFKFGLDINTAILNIDALVNCGSVYLSYQFSAKYYDKLFGGCHKICYGCCVRLCYCCCLPTELPEHIQLEHIQNSNNDGNNNNGHKINKSQTTNLSINGYDGVETDQVLSSSGSGTDDRVIGDGVDIIVGCDDEDDERP